MNTTTTRARLRLAGFGAAIVALAFASGCGNNTTTVPQFPAGGPTAPSTTTLPTAPSASASPGGSVPSATPSASTVATATPRPSGSATPTPSGSATPTPSASGSAALLGGGKIQHVVVVIMENRTVDNLFNGYPGADTVTSGLKHDGTMQALQPELLEVPCDPDHSHTGIMNDYDNGKNDGWDRDPPICSTVSGVVGGVPGLAPALANYGYVPQSEAQPYWDIAKQFALADKMFSSQTGPSYPGHLFIVAGGASYQDDDPNNEIWGCDSPAGTTVNVVGPGGAIVGSAFPCMDIPTLADRFDQASIPWRYYSNNEDVDTTGAKTSLDTVPYDAIRHIRYGPDWTSDFTLDDSQFITDVQNGKLPPMTWLNPPIVASDHPGGVTEGDTGLGPDYNATIVNTVMQSPLYKNNTVVLITWDDSGGWYDHVVPKQIAYDGLGYRVPLLAVSAYAKHNYISEVPHEYGSIVKFCEEIFGLPTLGAADARSDDLSDMFDFTQTPPAFTPINASYAHFRSSRGDALKFFANYHTEHGKLDSL